MAFRFRKSIRLFPSVRINLSKSGVSMTIGARGATVNLKSSRSTRTTVGISGSGASYTAASNRHQQTDKLQGNAKDDSQEGRRIGKIVLWFTITFIILAIVFRFFKL